jgi:hypothetical protein
MASPNFFCLPPPLGKTPIYFYVVAAADEPLGGAGQYGMLVRQDAISQECFTADQRAHEFTFDDAFHTWENFPGSLLS